MTLVLEQVQAGYGDRRVLHDIDAELHRGEVVAVLGPNGVGKSTLLRVCLGLLPAQGRVLLNGKPVHSLRPEERARRLAFLEATTRFSLPLSAGEVVLMGRHPYRSALALDNEAERQLAETMLRRTDSWELRARPFQELSSGERQRILLAAALAQEPEYLLLDEPTANLDLQHQAEFLRLLRDLCRAEQGPGVLMACHDLSFAAAIADRAWVLADGRLRANGRVSDVLTPELLQEVYGLPCVVQSEPESLRVLPLWNSPRTGAR